jgi:hypothetical protein
VCWPRSCCSSRRRRTSRRSSSSARRSSRPAPPSPGRRSDVGPSFDASDVGLLPADRRPLERHSLQPRLRVCRGAAQRPLLLHSHRERTLPGRAGGDTDERQPLADPALRPADRPARPRVPLQHRPDLRAAGPADAVRGERDRRAAALQQRADALDGTLVLGRRPGHRERDQALLGRAPGCGSRSSRFLVSRFLRRIRRCQAGRGSGSIEFLRNDVRGEHRVTLGQLAPRCARERERRERSRRELRLESHEVGSVRGQGTGEAL